jgi:hypothetical protein
VLIYLSGGRRRAECTFAPVVQSGGGTSSECLHFYLGRNICCLRDGPGFAAAFPLSAECCQLVRGTLDVVGSGNAPDLRQGRDLGDVVCTAGRCVKLK